MSYQNYFPYFSSLYSICLFFHYNKHSVVYALKAADKYRLLMEFIK